jgi:hypothetical protein
MKALVDRLQDIINDYNRNQALPAEHLKEKIQAELDRKMVFPEPASGVSVVRVNKDTGEVRYYIRQGNEWRSGTTGALVDWETVTYAALHVHVMGLIASIDKVEVEKS